MTVTRPPAADAAPEHVLRDLGWGVTRAGDELHGAARVHPEMHVPGTGHLRTSILATWADMLAGLLVVEHIAPRVPVTLELDVHLLRPAPGTGVVGGVGRMVKSGRSVSVAAVDFVGDDGTPFGFAAASFMPVPDERLTIARTTDLDEVAPRGTRLAVPFAERAGCRREAPGTAVLDHSPEVLNSSNTVNGGLIALVAEEAALSLAPGATLASLALRYLAPVRTGPVVAGATLEHGLARITVRDAGNGDRRCVMATGRTFAPGAAG